MLFIWFLNTFENDVSVLFITALLCLHGLCSALVREYISLHSNIFPYYRSCGVLECDLLQLLFGG